MRNRLLNELGILGRLSVLALIAYLGGLIWWFVGISENEGDIGFYGAMVKAGEWWRFVGYSATVAFMVCARLLVVARRGPDS